MKKTKFAQVKNGTVIDVIVAEQDFIDSLPKEEGVEWFRTDPDTLNNKSISGGKPFRGNYATIGGLYDKEKDIFTAPKPGIDWTLDEHLIWQPPIPYPVADEELDEFEFNVVWDDELYQKDKTKGWVTSEI